MNSLLTVATLGAAVAAINLRAQDPPVPLQIRANGDVYSPVCDVVVTSLAPAFYVGANRDEVAVVTHIVPLQSMLFVPDPVDTDCSHYWDLGSLPLTFY